MIRSKKIQLGDAFRAGDTEGTGTVSKAKWAETMQKVVGVKIQWQVK
jgi:hypothetical protein